MEKYLVLITTAQVRALMPIDHNLFRIIHFEKISDDSYLLAYQGPRELVIAKRNEIEVLLDETKMID